MTSGDDQVDASDRHVRPDRRAQDISAALWLARWFGIPFLIIVALYYAEPWIQGRHPIERSNTVLRQEVHPYPFPEGASGPSLAPPEVLRMRPPAVTVPPVAVPQVPAAEITARPVEQPQPAYPRRALQAEREGSVRVRLIIAPDGTVAKAEVVSARPPGWFEAAALDAVRRWRYQPPGRPIETEVDIEFTLR